MSRDLQLLHPVTAQKATLVINMCKAKGVDILVYCTLRTLEEQAKLYRQGRSREVIETKMKNLRNAGYDFLAAIIEAVGPQKGNRKLTNAAPGESWHNLGFAFDAVPLIGKEPAWAYEGNEELWKVYGSVCKYNGLTWGGDWKFIDYPHAQEHTESNPLRVYNPEALKRLLSERGLL
ncbi:hypothetical protein BZG01_00190 [Labilibaculum manganireducens]|uniref:Peptidase M15C domain-containing protein n=1 Tax=Labilibaculum manganireducens TaxID=1940525 RepID=A0A2N3IGE5_9BACT|nr:M15 family metallopeptidase [Labilibaculum manganireducens]PKQ69392.1 hypothetical protein BZG01_00190 [Labilibaculum manganireducens]